jgi:GNAT superfamily N-acetyltransferase
MLACDLALWLPFEAFASLQGARNMANMHDVGFRPYVASDFEPVAALWTRVNRELAPTLMEALFERYIATTIEAELSRLLDIFSQARRNAFWIVELADGSIVGTFGIECHNSDTTELRRMYIDAGWRGRGLAQRMLHTAEDLAREFGFSRMIVSTADVQHAALRFYTKSGFKCVRSEIAEAMTVKQAGGGLLRHYFEKVL